MEVVRKGKGINTKEVTCPECAAQLRVSRTDCAMKYDPRGVEYYEFSCPECNSSVILSFRAFKAFVDDSAAMNLHERLAVADEALKAQEYDKKHTT